MNTVAKISRISKSLNDERTSCEHYANSAESRKCVVRTESRKGYLFIYMTIRIFHIIFSHLNIWRRELRKVRSVVWFILCGVYVYSELMHHEKGTAFRV